MAADSGGRWAGGVVRAGAVLAALTASSGHAATPPSAPPPGCAAAGGPIVASLRGCAYGLPVTAGELLFVARSCRHEVAGKAVDRHTVEVRAVATGARVGQASLSPQPARGADPVDPGVVVGGQPPLLITPAGLAAIDPRRGTADVVFEPSGDLLGAARDGDLVAIAERLPGDKAGRRAIEWTVLDLERGAILGAALLADATVTDMRVARAGRGATAALTLGSGPTATVAEAVVVDANGELAAKDGVLAIKTRAVGPTSRSPAPADACPYFEVADRAVVGRVPTIRAAAAALGDVSAARAWRSPETCVALTRQRDGRTLAWVRSGGDLRLVAAACSTPDRQTAPAPK